MSIENRINSQIPEVAIINEVPHKPIPQEFASMELGEQQVLPPVEDAQNRFYRVGNIVRAYPALSDRQFINIVQEMMAINGSTLKMHESPVTTDESTDNRELIQKTRIGSGVTNIELTTTFGSFSGPDVTWKNTKIVRTNLLGDSHAILTEEGSLYSHDTTRKRNPFVRRHVTPFRNPLPKKDSSVRENEKQILHVLGLQQAETVPPEGLHTYAKKIVDLYKATHATGK